MLRISRLSLGAAAALLTLALAGPALAGHDDWDGDHGRRPYPVYRHGDSCDRDHDHGRWDERRGSWDRQRWDRGDWRSRFRAVDRHHDKRYGCGPCGRRWRDRDGFYRHLSRHHHIPSYWAPQVVVRADWGWLFRG